MLVRSDLYSFDATDRTAVEVTYKGTMRKHDGDFILRTLCGRKCPLMAFKLGKELDLTQSLQGAQYDCTSKSL